MSYIMDSLRALGMTLRNIRRPANTVQFPREIRVRPERFRTSFALVHDENTDEACIGCLQCERICPSRVITIKQAPKRESKFTGKKRGYAEDFTLDQEACIFCELCVQVCPTDAIIMLRTPDTPGYCREDLVLTMDKLYANEKLREHSWGNGTRLMAMQDSKADKGEKKAKAGEAPAKADAAGEAGEAKPVKAKPVKAKAAPAAAPPPEAAAEAPKAAAEAPKAAAEAPKAAAEAPKAEAEAPKAAEPPAAVSSKEEVVA